jgi:hypothetical protein
MMGDTLDGTVGPYHDATLYAPPVAVTNIVDNFYYSEFPSAITAGVIAQILQGAQQWVPLEFQGVLGRRRLHRSS